MRNKQLIRMVWNNEGSASSVNDQHFRVSNQYELAQKAFFDLLFKIGLLVFGWWHGMLELTLADDLPDYKQHPHPSREESSFFFLEGVGVANENAKHRGCLNEWMVGT